MGKELETYLEESRRRILGEAHAIAHSLTCPKCDLRFEALMVLALAGWDQDDFNTAWAEKLESGFADA
jgi:hypothetical protein